MRRPLQDLGGPRVNTPGGAPVSTFAVTDPSVQANMAPVGPTLLDFSGLASSIASAGQRRQDFEGEEFERIGKEAAKLHRDHPDWTNEQVIAEISKSTNSPHSVIRKLNKMFEDGDVDHPRFRMGLEGRRAQYALRSHLNAYTGENRAEWARRYAAAGPGKQGDVHREILAEIQESVNTEIGDQGYWGNSAISEALFEADMKILDMVEKDGRALMQYEDSLLIGKKFNDIATDANTNLFDIEEGSNEVTVDDKASIRINGEIARVHTELFGSGTEAPQRKFDEHIKGMAREIERVNGGEAAAVFLEDAYENVTNGANVKILQASGTTLDVLALADKYRNDALVQNDTKSISLAAKERDTLRKLATSGMQKRFREAAKLGGPAVLALREQIEGEVSLDANEIVNGLADDEKQFVDTYLARAEADAIREASTRRTIQGDKEYDFILEAAAADVDLAKFMMTEGVSHLTAAQKDDLEDRIGEIESQGVNAIWDGLDRQQFFTSIRPIIQEHLSTDGTTPSPQLTDQFEREALREVMATITDRAAGEPMSRPEIAELRMSLTETLREKYPPSIQDMTTPGGEATSARRLGGTGTPAEQQARIDAFKKQTSSPPNLYGGKPEFVLGMYPKGYLDEMWEANSKAWIFDGEDPVTALHRLSGEGMPKFTRRNSDGSTTPELNADINTYSKIQKKLKRIKEIGEFPASEVDKILTTTIARTGRLSSAAVTAGMRDPKAGEAAWDADFGSVQSYTDTKATEFFGEVGTMQWDEINIFDARFIDYREAERFLGPRPGLGGFRPLSPLFPDEKRAELRQLLESKGLNTDEDVMSNFIARQIENWK